MSKTFRPYDPEQQLLLPAALQKRLQRKVSRSRKGSNRRRKRVQTLARAHRQQRVSNHQAVHRFTSWVVRGNDFIAVEDLDIQRMVSSARGTAEAPGEMVQLSADRNRRALAQTWGKIRQQLTYKAGWAGRELAEVAPAFTSRTCSRCGGVARDPQVLPVFRRGQCGLRGAAAHNAAVNILRAGFPSREGGTKGLRPSLDTPQGVVSIGSLEPMRVEIPGADTS